MHPPPDAIRYRILIVDDNPSIHDDFRKILCPALSQSGAALSNMMDDLFGGPAARGPDRPFDVDSAFQGQEALAKVRCAEQQGRPYSLAFMDVRMPPGWDGIETVGHIWKEFPNLQVVVCTAYADYSWDQILLNLGETDSLVILKKPFDNIEVLQLAHVLTRKWQATRCASEHVASIAHDFNNLFTLIQGHASLQLAKSNLDVDAAHAFGQIKMASQRAARLVQRLLALSRQHHAQDNPLEPKTGSEPGRENANRRRDPNPPRNDDPIHATPA